MLSMQAYCCNVHNYTLHNYIFGYTKFTVMHFSDCRKTQKMA